MKPTALTNLFRDAFLAVHGAQLKQSAQVRDRGRRGYLPIQFWPSWRRDGYASQAEEYACVDPVRARNIGLTLKNIS